ncbi:MAG: transposase [Roseovarius sp.]|nr:transposase [Roseovarius sp.]
MADREIKGAGWMEFLCKNNIPFAIRVRENLRITTEEGHDLTLRARLRQARRGRSVSARLGSREDAQASNAPLLDIAAKPLKGKWLIIVTNVNPRTAINTYRKRRAIECLFGDAKTRGLNLEDTRLTDPRKLSLLMSLTALALGWAGRAAADLLGNRAPPRKSHGHYARSWFRTGFDHLRNRLRSDPLAAIQPWLRIMTKSAKISGVV